jgi:glycosyltransferase involved in cell wall biosynthesis
MVEKLITRRFDGVIAATDFIASRFTRHRVIAVRNYPPLALLQGARSGSNTEKQPLLIYIGGLAATRGIKEIVDAMSLLAVHPEARLKLIGPWIDKNVEKIVKASKGFEKVDYQGSMPWKDVWSHLLSARIGLVCFHPTPSHLVAGPNKLFEYMAAGLPIIASDFPEWRQIVEIAGCGLTVDPLNPAQLAQAVEYLLSHPQESEAMGKRGQQYVLERANWEREKDRLLDFFRQL